MDHEKRSIKEQSTPAAEPGSPSPGSPAGTCQSCRWLIRDFLPLTCSEPFFCEKLGAPLAYARTEERHDCWEQNPA